MNYHWETIHISGEENKICDALSRLCTSICFDFHKYKTPGPRLLKMSKVASVRNQQIEKSDPLVQKIAEEAHMDPDYIEMMNYIENNTDLNDISLNCELKQMGEFMDRMSIVALDAGTRLIVKDGTEILMIPMKKSKQIIDTLHFSHSAADSHDHTVQTQNILAWSEEIFTEKIWGIWAMPTAHSLSDNTLQPSQQWRSFNISCPVSFFKWIMLKKGNGNYLIIVDSLTGFMQAYKTPRKSTKDAIKCLRDCQVDGVCPTRSVYTLKEILNKNNNLNQLNL